MRLFVSALQKEVGKLDENGVRQRVVGDLAAFEPQLQALIRDAERRTMHNTRLQLTICASYGGRWDILQSMRSLLAAAPDPQALARTLTEQQLAAHLSLSFAPDPDLLIRTGGEQRISNFLLWQCAYSELYFTHTLWPDFDAAAFDAALAWFATRERRFGQTSAQVARSATEELRA
jgi:undecaprenyl diphosphate synthase